MKKFALLIAILLSLVLVFSSCGENESKINEEKK